MQDILRKQHYRSVFYLVFILAVALILVLRAFVLPSFSPELSLSTSEFVAQILDGLAISLIVTAAIGSFLFWLTPEIIKRSPIEVLEPKEIGPLLVQAAARARTWVYRGGCGRYTRAKTLPSIADAARKEGVGRDIRIAIMNPANDALCQEYATYRRSLKSADPTSPWTVQRVKEELIATAIATLRFQHQEPLLRMRLHLVDHFSAFRFDISDDYVVVTKEDREAPGLRADTGTYFYDSYRDDIALTERQSRSVTYDNEALGSKQITGDELEAIVLGAQLIGMQTLSELNRESILTKVNKPRDPYT